MMQSVAVNGARRGAGGGLVPSRRGGVLMGCLIAFGIVVILLIAGGIWVAGNWRWIVANPIRNAIVAEIEASDLPDEQKVQLKADVETLTDQFKSGAITLDQLGRVGEEIEESPLLQIGAVYLVRSKYIEPSGLTDEEKADAQLQLERFARGVYEETIPESKVEAVVRPISVQTGDGQYELREPGQVSDENLREMIGLAEQAADEAQVPDERFEIDVATEFRAAIDRGLGRSLDAPGGG